MELKMLKHFMDIEKSLQGLDERLKKVEEMLRCKEINTLSEQNLKNTFKMQEVESCLE